MANGFQHGKSGKASISGTDYRIVEWEMNFKIDMEDVSSTGVSPGHTNAGYDEYITGFSGATGNITLVANACSMPTVKQGDNVPLVLTAFTGTVFTFPEAVISQRNWKVNVKNRIEVKYDVTITGDWTETP